MEETTPVVVLPLELEPLAYPFLCILLNLSLMVLEKFYPTTLAHLYLFLFHFQTDINSSCEIKTQIEDQKKVNQTEPQIEINGEGISFIMEKLGLNLAKEGDSLNNSMRNKDFSMLFEDSEPILDEVKEAFSVFDMNKDGFFDVRDLQRVLINLGIKEGLHLKACELMIDRHDRNGDGKIDLRDFSRLLETSLTS